MSATRFKRNNKLMAEVFSDSIVPDGRMVVNEQRMSVSCCFRCFRWCGESFLHAQLSRNP